MCQKLVLEQCRIIFLISENNVELCREGFEFKSLQFYQKTKAVNNTTI